MTMAVVTDVVMDDSDDGSDIQINFDLSMPDLVCQVCPRQKAFSLLAAAPAPNISPGGWRRPGAHTPPLVCRPSRAVLTNVLVPVRLSGSWCRMYA
jgi:hypothetical protein